MIKYILTLLSFLLCSCGRTDSPSITKTTQQVAITPTPEITGPFVEISNAFPDVDLWFNWTDPNNNPPFNAGVQLAAAVDLDNDGKKEMVLTYYTGGAHCCDDVTVFEKQSKNRYNEIFHSDYSVEIDSSRRLLIMKVGRKFDYFYSCYACTLEIGRAHV